MLKDSSIEQFPFPAGASDRREALAWCLAATTILGGCSSKSSKPATYVDLTVTTDGDFLAFKPDVLTCPTGAHVRLIFQHAGQYVTQEHNWVLVLPGATDAVEKAAEQAGEARGWLPPRDPRVIAATPLCGRGATAMAQFVAPAPGRYPFLCTFPGHGAEMRGTLIVTA